MQLTAANIGCLNLYIISVFYLILHDLHMCPILSSPIAWCAGHCYENKDFYCSSQSKSFACVKECEKKPEKQ